MARYYKSYQHDHEDCIESGGEIEYHIWVNENGKPLTEKQSVELADVWNNNKDEYYEFIDNKGYKYIDNVKLDFGDRRSGEQLIIRVDRKGKTTSQQIQSPYCDFQEHFIERIKAPKGYLKRLKERKSWEKNLWNK